MADKFNLNEDEYQAIKGSFFRVFHCCLNKGMISKDVVSILFKWAIQLKINENELDAIDADVVDKKEYTPEIVLEDLYNLVYMIYLDNKVEDIELKVVSEYATDMGYKPYIVNDLLKAIVTAPFDGFDYSDVRRHLKDILSDYDQD